MRRNKYHSSKCIFEGETFDSKKELNRWLELRLMERAGEIYDLARQVPFELIPVQRGDEGKVVERAVKYLADFTYRTKKGEFVVEDTKGVKTDVYILKRKLMLYIHNIKIKEI